MVLKGPICPDDVSKALLCACQEGLTECVSCMLAAGVDPDVQDASGNPALFHAVSEGRDDVVRELCKAKASVNFRCAGGNTPLHMAAKWGKDGCTEILLQSGSNVNARDSSESTPLMLAVRSKQYVAIALLLEAGCHANARDAQGRTALHYASHTAVSVQRLLQAGADVNIQDNDGCTPLTLAASEGLENVITALTQVPGCNPNLANHSARKTPLHIISPKGHVNSVRDLIGCGADLNLLDAHGRTSLWYAVANGRSHVVAVLLQCNSQVDTYQCPENCDPDNCPVRLAFAKGHVDILKLFIASGYDSWHVRQCLGQADAATLFRNALHWLHYGQEVTSLKQTCRKWIRHFLGANLVRQCSHLPLPTKLTDFIMIKELNDLFS